MSIEPIRRKRAFLPKVKTGCKTCKLRKVKCDEAKPFCRRCTSTGRTCEGYARDTSPSSTNTSAVPVRSASPNQQQLSTGVESWLESDRERRSFHFFLTRAGLRLGGYFQTPFWTREVMQAAIYYPSIRHLVVALGSAYEHFEGRQLDPSQMEFALQQANQSIRHLTQSPTSSLTKQSVETSSTLVTASLLFTILSSMQGHMTEAMDHVRSGLRLLQNMEYAQDSSDDSSSSSSGHSSYLGPAYPVPVGRLQSLLTSLYLQCRAMVDDEDIPGWSKDPLVTDNEPPTSFASLNEAQDYVEALYGNQLSFFWKTANNPPSTDNEIYAAQAHQDGLLYALDCSRNALDAFVTRMSPDSNPEDEAAVKVLRLYHVYLEIRMGVGCLRENTRELAFDEFEPQFEQMLAYCRDLLDASETLQPVCCSGLGVVIPLHMIAHRCRNVIIRTEAVELLLRASRREGLWDSSVVGRIAATTSALEQDEELLRQWRVREVKTQFVSDRRAKLVFIAASPESSDQRRYYREIDW